MGEFSGGLRLSSRSRNGTAAVTITGELDIAAAAAAGVLAVLADSAAPAGERGG
jgi:hypothetical protein